MSKVTKTHILRSDDELGKPPFYRFNQSGRLKSEDLSNIHFYVKDLDKKIIVKFPDIFKVGDYVSYKTIRERLPRIKSGDRLKTYYNSVYLAKPLSHYLGQLTAAIICATTCCGVSNEQLFHPIDRVAHFYRWHVYYTVRRIFEKTGTLRPGDNNYFLFENPTDLGAWREVLTSFNLDWDNMTRLVTMTPFFRGYDQLTRGRVTIDSVARDPNRWSKCIPDKSPGLNRIGSMHIGESIMVYCYSILNAQSLAMGILGYSSAAVESKRRFMINIDACIKRGISKDVGFDLVTSAQQVMGMLEKVPDFNLGEGLYLIPTDMLVKSKIIVNFNDRLISSRANQPLGQDNAEEKKVDKIEPKKSDPDNIDRSTIINKKDDDDHHIVKHVEKIVHNPVESHKKRIIRDDYKYSSNHKIYGNKIHKTDIGIDVIGIGVLSVGFLLYYFN